MVFNIPPIGRLGCRKGNKENDHRSKKHKNDTFLHFTQIGGGRALQIDENRQTRMRKKRKQPTV